MNPALPPRTPIYIGKADYTVSEGYTLGDLARLTRAQNQHRATLGMPLLPDLTTVTHDAPAVAPPAPGGDDDNGDDDDDDA